MSPSSITLLRHGDTGQRSYRGQLDDPLTDLGWQQLRAATIDGGWDVVVTSTLQRCAAFARELAEARGLPLTLDARLREYHFGDWQGIPVADLDRDHPEALGRFWADPERHPPPNAEPFDTFRQRLCDALDAIVADPGNDGRRVLVVTHGGVIKQLLALAAGRSSEGMAALQVAHASMHPLHWPPA